MFMKAFDFLSRSLLFHRGYAEHLQVDATNFFLNILLLFIFFFPGKLSNLKHLEWISLSLIFIFYLNTLLPITNLLSFIITPMLCPLGCWLYVYIRFNVGTVWSAHKHLILSIWKEPMWVVILWTNYTTIT